MNDQTIYYTRACAIAHTGVADATFDRWANQLRDTDMVRDDPTEGGTVYSEDFVAFVRTRMDAQGPASLPEPGRIAELCRLWRVTDGNIEEIARCVQGNKLVIAAQLAMIGLGGNDEKEE